MIPPSNILILTEGQIGDLLLLTPAIRGLRSSFPAARISLMVLERRGVDEASGELIADGRHTVLSTNPHIDAIHVVRRDRLRRYPPVARVRAEIQLLRFIRRSRYDSVICTFPEDRFAIWAFFSKAHRRVGQKRQPFSRLLTDTPDISKRDKGVLEYYCDLARALGATVNSSATEYHVPAESRQWADRFFAEQKLEAKVIAIHPGATGDYKIWPPERYAGLIHRIRAFGAVHLLLVYGTGDRNVVNEIRRHLRAKIPEVCTEEIGKLGALLQQSALLISNDSGPRHLAAALGTPTLTLFRHYHDREWKIYQDDRTHSTLQGNGICTACPAEICKDIIPEGERFGSICLRMVTVEDAYRRGIDLLKG